MTQKIQSISQNVTEFIRQFSDKNHRFYSWEHCYKYFREKQLDPEKGSLHLSFYLASWGMYRGSSFLLWKDYLIHKEVVKKIISVRDKYQNINFLNTTQQSLKEIVSLSKWISEWYSSNTGLINGEKRKTIPTEVLISKILLGTLGCVPAYDRYFIEGLKQCQISPKNLSIKGLSSIVNFYVKNHEEIDGLSKKIKVGNEPYPTMKIIDMYFWQLGIDKIGYQKES